MDASQSKIKIANLALFKIACGRISSFTQQGSDAAAAVNEIYPDSLEFCLEEYDWSFATRTVALATLADAPVNYGDGIIVAYAYPEAYLRPLSNAAFNIGPALIRLEESGILSDTRNLLMKYIFKNDDPATYSAQFRNAVACKLASDLCNKLTKKEEYAVKMQQEYDKAIRKAMSLDSKGATPIQPRSDEWEIARLAGSGGFVAKPDGNVGFWPTF